MRIAIFGGTFDPIHIGHLILAREVVDKYELDKVIFVPSGIPPHKAHASITPGERRMDMIRLAIEFEPSFEVSSYELDKPGVSYSYDTIEHFRESFGDSAKLFYIIGADQVLMLSTWKRIESIASMCTLIGAHRPGYDIDSLSEEVRDYNVSLVQIPQLEISSSDIRRRVALGRSIRYHTTDLVKKYIEENKLYRG